MTEMARGEAAFRAHAADVLKYRGLDLNETNTRIHLIDPLLRILGYSSFEDLGREVPVPATKESLDYELRVNGRPHAIVEAKALHHVLGDSHAAQAVQYAAVLGVRWCLVTNGLAWALYDAYGKGALPQKRIAEVRLDGDERALAEAWRVLSLFQHDSIPDPHPVARVMIERAAVDELTRVGSGVVEAVRRAVRTRFDERVSGEAVVAALSGLLRADRPAAPTPPSPPKRSTPPSRARGPLGLGDLVAMGLLPAEAVVETSVGAVTHVGRLNGDGIDVEGAHYSSLSAASSALRNDVARNGWRDWRYKGESLEEIRTRAAAREQRGEGLSPA